MPSDIHFKNGNTIHVKEDLEEIVRAVLAGTPFVKLHRRSSDAEKKVIVVNLSQMISMTETS